MFATDFLVEYLIRLENVPFHSLFTWFFFKICDCWIIFITLSKSFELSLIFSFYYQFLLEASKCRAPKLWCGLSCPSVIHSPLHVHEWGIKNHRCSDSRLRVWINCLSWGFGFATFKSFFRYFYPELEVLSWKYLKMIVVGEW